MKNIVIFGGAGFIGTNLTKRLLDKDNKVLCFDNLSTSDISNTELFKDNPNVIYGGTIPYSEVQKKMDNSDITVIVEGFLPKDIDCSRYSLSTKAADALASGATILTYGSQECGIIEYMQSTKASFVCTQKENLVEVISSGLILSFKYLPQIGLKAQKMQATINKA